MHNSNNLSKSYKEIIKQHVFTLFNGINVVLAIFVFFTGSYRNMLFMITEQYIKLLGIQKLGVCEFFCLLFVLYEAVSILKNMTLCGLPVPKKLKEHIKEALSDMTDEMPQESKDE